MQQLLDMLAKGNYRGLALLLLVIFSGVMTDIQKVREGITANMGPDSFMTEFVVGIISLVIHFTITIVAVATVMIIILQDAGIDIVPDRFKKKK